MSDLDDQIGGGTARENNERDILIKGVNMGLGKSLLLEKLLGKHRMTPS